MPLSKTFQALSDPNRQRIIELLKKKDMAAGDLLEHFPMSGASLSHHLSILKQADLISSRREGQRIIYTVNLSVIEELMESLAKLIKT